MKNLKIHIEYTLLSAMEERVKLTRKITVSSYDEWLMAFIPTIQLLGFYVVEIKTFPTWEDRV